MEVDMKVANAARVIEDGYAFNPCTFNNEAIVVAIDIHHSKDRLYYSLDRKCIIKTNMTKDQSKYVVELLIKNMEFIGEPK